MFEKQFKKNHHAKYSKVQGVMLMDI